MFDSEFAYTAPRPLVIEFDPPLQSGTGSLSRLSLAEPIANHVWVAEQHLTARNGTRGQRLYQKALIAKVAGVPEEILDSVPIGAFTRATRFLQDFIEAGLPDPAEADSSAAMPPSLTITFAEPITNGTTILPAIVLREPTLGQMAKAESGLGDMSAQRVRAYQEQLVAMASGESSVIVSMLPISVLNRAASYVLGFSAAGRATSA